MGKNYSKTIYNATFKLCPKNKNQKKHSMEVWITFSVISSERGNCAFSKKKKIDFLPLLINLNSVIPEVKTLDLNTEVSKKIFFNWICFKLKVSSNAY